MIQILDHEFCFSILQNAWSERDLVLIKRCGIIESKGEFSHLIWGKDVANQSYVLAHFRHGGFSWNCKVRVTFEFFDDVSDEVFFEMLTSCMKDVYEKHKPKFDEFLSERITI